MLFVVGGERGKGRRKVGDVGIEGRHRVLVFVEGGSLAAKGVQIMDTLFVS